MTATDATDATDATAATAALDAIVAKLDALLVVTALPPADLDPDTALTAFATIATARSGLIAELTTLAMHGCHDPRATSRKDELMARDQAWIGMLGRCRILVDQRLGAVRRLRSSR